MAANQQAGTGGDHDETARCAQHDQLARFARYLLGHPDADGIGDLPVRQLGALWELWQAAVGGVQPARPAPRFPEAGGSPDADGVASPDHDAPSGAIAWHPTSVRLSRDDLAQLELLAASTGFSRNELMRLFMRIGMREAHTITPKDRRADVDGR